MREHNRIRGRDGFALPVALLAMIVIGAVVTGGFYVSAQEHEVSLSSDLGAQALFAAEYGIEERLGEWVSRDFLDFPPGGSEVFPVRNGARTVGSYTIRLFPVGGNAFMMESEGVVTRGQRTARRRAATFVRTLNAQMPYQGAMSVIGQLRAGGNSLIDGNDNCLAGNSQPAVMAQDVDYVTKQGNAQVLGSPAVDADPDMDPHKLSQFGDVNLQDLIASATKRYTVGQDPEPRQMGPKYSTENGENVCNTDHPENWGDLQPDGPCSDYLPIIYVDARDLNGNAQDWKLTTGKGQGILIVDGNLEIAGNLEFDGVVIVTGSFRMAGTGQGTGKVNGSVIVQGDSEVDTSNTTGDAQVIYDSCSVARAFDATLRARPFASRSWVLDAAPVP